MSLFFKSIAVRRIYDQKNNTLIYVAYSRQIKDAGAQDEPGDVSLYNTHPQLDHRQAVTPSPSIPVQPGK
jgi:CreA protein